MDSRLRGGRTAVEETLEQVRRFAERSAEGQVAGDCQDQNAPLGHCERHPEFPVKASHNRSSAPQNSTPSDLNGECIIAELYPGMQEKMPCETVSGFAVCT